MVGAGMGGMEMDGDTLEMGRTVEVAMVGTGKGHMVEDRLDLRGPDAVHMQGEAGGNDGLFSLGTPPFL